MAKFTESPFRRDVETSMRDACTAIIRAPTAGALDSAAVSALREVWQLALASASMSGCLKP
jgi:hypothetical protein